MLPLMSNQKNKNMAIRNLDAITRYGEMIAEQKRNTNRLREEHFNNRLNIIKSSHSDAIDAMDTICALSENGLRSRFEEWEKNQNVYFDFQRHRFYVICKVDEPKKENAIVSYYPSNDNICFSWNGWGMSECSSTNVEKADCLIHRLSQHGYEQGLTDLCERLQPYLNAFFKWLNSL